MSKFVVISLLLCLAVGHPPSAMALHDDSADHAERAPNIIFFLVDDLGWQDTQLPLAGVETRNNQLLRTPGVLRLAREGVTLTNAYAASPVCSPTRASILTGLHPARTRITDWLGHVGPDNQPKPSEHSPDHQLALPDWNRVGLTSAHTTLPKTLRELGYTTIHIGKAHLGARGTEGADPTTLGFDMNIAGSHRGGPGSYYGTDDFGRPESGWQVPDLEAYHGTETYLTDALTIEAEQRIRSAASNANTPFFLHLSHYGVHTPIQADPKRLQHYVDLGMTMPEARYASMIESVDASLVRILDLLDELAIAENTIVWFFSDNGCLTAHSGPVTTAAPLKGGKGTAYEGGYRVPMVVRYPGVIPPASRSAALALSDDVFPTLIDLIGGEGSGLPHRVDGVSLADVLRADVLARPREAVVIHYPHYWWKFLGNHNTPGIEPFTAIRSGDWKLIYFYRDERSELYNIATDIGENHDLAGSRTHQHIRSRLEQQLATWMRAHDAQVPADRNTGQPLPPVFMRSR